MLADYEAQLAKQGGKCAICFKPPSGKKILGIDHCHKRGKVRGLLCDRCNTGLGLFLDDPANLRMALYYLAWGNIGDGTI